MPTRATSWVGCFQALGDLASVAHNAAMSLTSAGCFECWLYPFTEDLVSFPVVMAKGNINTAYQMVIGSDDKLFGEIYVSAVTKKAIDPSVVPRNQWTHYAFRWNGTNIQLVKNGTQIATTAAGNCDTNTNPLRFGDANTAKSNSLAALIYDARLWNIYRNDATIASEMSSLVSASATGLIGNWLFSEGIGVSVADRTSNAFNLTVANSHQWSSNVAKPY
jgi:hypothetical protein